ncbi:hypothetical protein ACFSND_12265 [Brevibacillus brevis]|uniref:hypothetical protein n=1 Tax=Brevibacillus brevis TaxID=1393 RepID=UPI0036274328
MRGTNIGHPAPNRCRQLQQAGTTLGRSERFLMAYYGSSVGQKADEPLGTVTTRDRFGLVTIHGQDYQIVDIGMRMLEPHELFRRPRLSLTHTSSIGTQTASCILNQHKWHGAETLFHHPFAEALVRANCPNYAPDREIHWRLRDTSSKRVSCKCLCEMTERVAKPMET